MLNSIIKLISFCICLTQVFEVSNFFHFYFLLVLSTFSRLFEIVFAKFVIINENRMSENVPESFNYQAIVSNGQSCNHQKLQMVNKIWF